MWEEATGAFQWMLLSLVWAPFLGAISIVAAVFGARRFALSFALLTVGAMGSFSLLPFFWFYGGPLIVVWVLFISGLLKRRSEAPTHA